MKNCTRFLSGHPPQTPTEVFTELARYCASNAIEETDCYGKGSVLNAFEAQLAALMGKEAAVFMPSGTMAQLIALRIWADRASCPNVAFHATSHLELNEAHSYSKLHGLTSTLLGNRSRLMTTADLRQCLERISALLIELPQRRLGGLLPSWEGLLELQSAARERGARLQLDGARIWESQPYYDRPMAEICQGFDSVYLSFYKGLGGLTGSMLLGNADFVAEARVWQNRHGGNLYQLGPYVVSAKLNYEKRSKLFKSYLERARRLAVALSNVEGLVIMPGVPQTNMMHVHIARPVEALARGRDFVAKEDRFWLGKNIFAGESPGHAFLEVVIGDCALKLSDEEVADGFRKLLKAAL